MTSPNSRRGNWREPARTSDAARRRARRVREGERQRAEERRAWSGLPVTRSELLLPILKLAAKTAHRPNSRGS